MKNLCENIDVVPSNGHIWNGWVAYLDKDGEPIEPYQFRSGSWWKLMEHLKECRKCRVANGVTLRWVERELKIIEREWLRVTDP